MKIEVIQAILYGLLAVYGIVSAWKSGILTLNPVPAAKVNAVRLWLGFVGLFGVLFYPIAMCSLMLEAWRRTKQPGLDAGQLLLLFLAMIIALLSLCVAIACLATAFQVKKHAFSARQRVIATAALSALIFPWGLGAFVSLWAYKYFRE